MEVGMDQLVISVAEACGVTRLGRTKLNELIRNGTLDSVKVGQRRLIKVASINRLLEAA
jgi:excisionase family DNA binding protein